MLGFPPGGLLRMLVMTALGRMTAYADVGLELRKITQWLGAAAGERCGGCCSPMMAAEERRRAEGIGADSVVADGRRPREPLRAFTFRNANALQWVVFKAVQDSEWSARHIAAHGVTLY